MVNADIVIAEYRLSAAQGLRRIVSPWRVFMTDRIKIVCSNCRNNFHEREQRLKPGHQTQCPHCMRLITFDSGSEDPNIRRPLKAARDFRLKAEETLVLAQIATQEPRRDREY